MFVSLHDRFMVWQPRSGADFRSSALEGWSQLFESTKLRAERVMM